MCSATLAQAVCLNGACTCPSGTFNSSGLCCPNKLPGQNIQNCGYCTDTNNDTMNCGGCSTPMRSFACPAGTTCQFNGSTNVCACPTSAPKATGGLCCPAQQSGQNIQACNGYCTDANNDQLNCGACNATCFSIFGVHGRLCQNDACVPNTSGSCPGNLMADANGDCVLCPANTQYAGFNTCCPISTPTLCGGATGTCTNALTDSNNCGGCGNVCPTGMTCQSGTCVCSSGTVYAGFNRCCPSGQTLCGGASGTCVNLQTDNNNCNACGNACASGQSCINGACM
jgi:hypothetical protein